MLIRNVHTDFRLRLARILVLAMVLAVGGSPAVQFAGGQADDARGTATDAATTLQDQTELAVTVYNSDVALVRDVRRLTLPTGTFRLRFEDVAATINPVTVHLALANGGGPPLGG